MANRWVMSGFALVLAGAVLPFLMVIGVLPSALGLSVLSYGCSVSGIFLGLIGAAAYAAERRRGDWRDDEDEYGSR